MTTNFIPSKTINMNCRSGECKEKAICELNISGWWLGHCLKHKLEVEQQEQELYIKSAYWKSKLVPSGCESGDEDSSDESYKEPDLGANNDAVLECDKGDTEKIESFEKQGFLKNEWCLGGVESNHSKLLFYKQRYRGWAPCYCTQCATLRGKSKWGFSLSDLKQ